MKRILSDAIDGLDVPIIEEDAGFFKRKKVRLIIINEDSSFTEYFRKYPRSYLFKIKKKLYLLVPCAIIRGKFPTLVYYYNNPFPLRFVFEYSKLRALDLKSMDQLKDMKDEEKTLLAQIQIDAETLNLAWDTRVMRAFYENAGLTWKVFLIIAIVAIIIIIVFLQLFGVINIGDLLSSAPK